MFLENAVFVLAMLLGLGATGGFVLLPFCQTLPFAMLGAPLAGVLLVPLGTMAFYVLLKVSTAQAVALSVGLGSLATGVSLWMQWPRLRPQRSWFLLAGVVLLLTGINVGLQTITSIKFGSPALLYMDGTDHLGYAHTADWLNSHTITTAPRNDPEFPYESWPNLTFLYDPRFGSYCFLALISLFYGQAAMFSYSVACAVVLTATILGVAAVFSKTRLALVLLILGLVTCHWFDYSYTGYFAKLLSFPSILFVVGLVFVTVQQRQFDLWVLTLLVLLTAGTAIMQSGASAALFMVTLIGPFLGLTWIELLLLGQTDGFKTVLKGANLLLLLLAVAVLSGGGINRPLAPGFPDYSLKWDYILPRLAELETQGLGISGFTSTQVAIATWVSLGIWVVFAAIALWRKSAVALALQLGPMLLLLVLVIVNATAATFQMIGLFYPIALCGVLSLLDAPPKKRWRNRWDVLSLLILALVVLTLVMHQPRFLGMVSRFCTDKAPKIHQFTVQQMDELARTIGTETVDIDIRKIPQFPIAVMVDMGRRNLGLQWLPDTWKIALGYRGWEPPTYPTTGTYRLTLLDEPVPAGASIAYETNQYRLLRQAP